MTFDEIRTAVNQQVEDHSTGIVNDLDAVINEVYEETVFQVQPGSPDLMTISSIGTRLGKNFLSLPDESSQKVCVIWNPSTKKRVTFVPGGVVSLTEKFGHLAEVGAVCFWAQQGSKIYYQGIPASAVDLNIYHYSKPTVLVDDGDIPVSIPAWLHRKILVHGTAYKFFSEIEQEGEQEGLETRRQRLMFEDGKSDYSEHIASTSVPPDKVAWDV